MIFGWKKVHSWKLYIEGFISGTAQVSGIGIIRTDGSMRRWEEGKIQSH